MTYTDKQRVEIAKKEYDDWRIRYKVKLKNGKKIGEVSQVFNKPTGEQSFVITDHYVPPTAALKEREAVEEVTILYRGSSFDLSSDTLSDWVVNDVPTAMQVLNGGGATAMPQLASSAQTLQEAMEAYPNAKVSVYGHSLGSMNGQYAIAALPERFHERIDGVYVYEGPNIYKILNAQQQATADKLTEAGKIFNFVDPKDLIPIGYSVAKKQVGVLIEVDSKKTGMLDQHMWGGYQFDKEGNVLSRSKGTALLARHETNKELNRLNDLRKKLSHGGSGLSAAQEIFLDAMQAKAITLGYKQSIQAEIDALVKWLTKEIANAQNLWRHTKADAQRFGAHLSYAEIMEALASRGVTEYSIMRQPAGEYENLLRMLRSTQSELDDLLKQIAMTIDKQVATDKELANYLF